MSDLENPKMGINESREVLEALMDLSVCLAGLLKDGLQLKDAVELWDMLGKDEPLRKSLDRAMEGYKKIPEEMNDLDVMEGIDLAQTVLARVPELVNAIKK